MEPPSKLVVERSTPGPLVDRMAFMAATGTGWLNILPEIPDDVPVPPTPSSFAVFSKRGPVVPLATWTAPAISGRRIEPAQVGVQHGIARPVAERLAGTPAAVPAGWRQLQDHARRGLVVVPPPDEPLGAVAGWIMAVLQELCIPPHTTRFEVYVYEA